MRNIVRRWRGALLPLLFACAGCDGDFYADGTRSPCAAGGQILGCEESVETIEDACWKLVQCGVIPIDTSESEDPSRPPREQDWAGCVARLERRSEATAEIAIQCVRAASCDQLIVNDSPGNAYQWPDCLELQ